MASFYRRYLAGECESVWQEIYDLKQKAFEKETIKDIQDVLQETMTRVKYNVDLIYSRLSDMKYKFFEELVPRIYPDEFTEKQLLQLDESVGRYGFVPLSLKEFYRVVGSAFFMWDYDNYPEQRWFEYSDPLCIDPLDYILSEFDDRKEYIDEQFLNNEQIYINISPDYYHKDNVSGGMPYSIEITKEPSIDSRVLFEEHNCTFIEYLRKCFEYGGFPRVAVDNSNYEGIISKLTAGLKPI